MIVVDGLSPIWRLSIHTCITVTLHEIRGISNHRQFDYSFNSFFRLSTEKHKISALLVHLSG